MCQSLVVPGSLLAHCTWEGCEINSIISVRSACNQKHAQMNAASPRITDMRTQSVGIASWQMAVTIIIGVAVLAVRSNAVVCLQYC